jgi:hypothetical protein
VNSAKATAGLILDDIKRALIIRTPKAMQRLSYA